MLRGIHGLDRATLPQLRRMTPATEITELTRDYHGFGWPRPVFDLALRWLADNDPEPAQHETLVHGDFRNGNLIIGGDGIPAVLRWELALFGDPLEDPGWFRANWWPAWRNPKPGEQYGRRALVMPALRRSPFRSRPGPV